MFRSVPFVIFTVGVFGGKSPNADYLESTLRLHPGATYSQSVLEDAKLDVPDLARKYGYPLESHEVITEDGYVLMMHRMPHGKDSIDPNKQVVFLMHGLLSSSADFLALGPGNALAYYLVEEGYDIWMGNARGNFYSRHHHRMNPDSLSQEFWKFSWDEIGNYDLPAFIDYIIRITQQSKIHYIGHSQGGTAFLVLNSLRPEYNKKFVSFQGLAPASFFTYNDQPFTVMANLENVLEPAAFAAGLGEVFRNRYISILFTKKFCYGGIEILPICESIILKGSTNYYNATMFPVFLGDAPAGASIRQFAHYAQSIKYNTFRRFKHSPLINLAKYGSVTPPSYNLSQITVPSYIHYGTNDTLVDRRDVEVLISKLPNIVRTNLVDSFSHLDFIWGNEVNTKVYLKALGILREAERDYL